MDEELISKKDLLRLKGISYGQLYRWKRKGLLPEEWFLRKSTYTGQETFFPREKVLARVDKIQSMKENVSLDDLADVFSPNVSDIVLKPDELCKKNIVTREVLELYFKLAGKIDEFHFQDILAVYSVGRLLTSGKVNLDEGKTVAMVLREGLDRFKDEPCELVLARKLGVFICLMLAPPCKMIQDRGLVIIDKIEIAASVEQLKLKLA